MALESQGEARHSRPQGEKAWAGLSLGRCPLSLLVCAHCVQGGAWKVSLGALQTSPHLPRTPGLASSCTGSLGWHAFPAPLPASFQVSNEMCPSSAEAI